MKLTKFIEIKGKIRLKSGLHIGSGDTEMKIGGTDNTVIKHPHTLEPYIPGSSLKGKVRSLLEMRSGLMKETGGEPLSLKVLNNIEDEQKKECENILKLFGTSGADQGEEDLGPTRVSFADCPLSKNWKEKAYEQHLPLTEVKPENRINRIKGTAEHPRFTERVPAGAEFDFTVTLKILEESEEEELKILLLEGLKLLQMDALGGNGSRGYGRIEFVFEDEDTKKEFDEINPFSGATR